MHGRERNLGLHATHIAHPKSLLRPVYRPFTTAPPPFNSTACGTTAPFGYHTPCYRFVYQCSLGKHRTASGQPLDFQELQTPMQTPRCSRSHKHPCDTIRVGGHTD